MIPLPLAVALLTSPAVTQANLHHLKPIVVVLAESWELIDPSERGCVELETIRRRMVELQGAPMSWERWRFPDAKTCRHAIAVNQAFYADAELASRAFPDDVPLVELVWDIYSRRIAWEKARDVWGWPNVVTTRQRLWELRRQLGDQAFYLGALPEPGPWGM